MNTFNKVFSTESGNDIFQGTNIRHTVWNEGDC
jgi:hypothetical protein